MADRASRRRDSEGSYKGMCGVVTTRAQRLRGVRPERACPTRRKDEGIWSRRASPERVSSTAPEIAFDACAAVPSLLRGCPGGFSPAAG